MKTIAVVCEKGGTGKSVIANELYESYVRQGVRASLYSLDGQYKDASSAKNVVKIPQSEAIVQAQGVRKSVVDVDRNGAAAEAIRAMCRKVSALAGLPFEKKQLKKIDTH